ncbi:MAG: acyl carrier protein [Pseudomonadota bacterium]
MQNKQEIYEKLREVLVELFEIEPTKISLQANLYTELDIDSIDAVDLVIKLKEITGKKIQAEEFKQVRTVNDVVETLHNLLNAPAA